MTELGDNSRGAISLLLIILMVAIIYGAYVIFFKKDAPSETRETNITVVDDSNDSAKSANDGSHQKIISLKPVNDYDARGKLIINTDKFGAINLDLALVLPDAFETTYYEAHLEGAKTLNLGKLTRINGVYKLDYGLGSSIDDYDSIVIIVDGDATTVEGKTLPHDVMQGQLD